jgi:hypothetical protein
MRHAWMLGFLAACGGVDSSVEHDAVWMVDHVTTDGAVLGVWGSGPDDVWAVGGQVDSPLVLHGDGARWTPVGVEGNSLLWSVYGFSATDVYAVGEAGLILHFDGSSWTRVVSGTDLLLYGVWGSSGDDVWIVGGDRYGSAGSAIVLRGTRGSFSRVEMPPELAPSVLFKVHGFAPDDVYLVGNEGVLRWNGTAWRREPMPTTEPLRAMWGQNARDIYAVGGNETGEIFRYDGQQWTEVANLSIGLGLSGVFTSADGPTIAVGANALVFELDHDGSLINAKLPTTDSLPFLHAVWGDGHGTTYTVGGDLHDYPAPMTGTIFRRQ